MERYKKIVIKIGTKVIATKDNALDKDRMKDIVGQISEVMDRGIKVILVTSGAIGSGMGLLGLKKRPTDLHKLQAAASIGQSWLMQLYGEYFKERGYLAGQVLLTQEDFDDRKRYLNIKYTIETLLKNGAVPIINENDAVSTDEIKCGDNDRLSSLVSDLCQAEKLIILTDVDGLLDEECEVISLVEEITPRISKLVRMSRCDLGTGGMSTKIEAAKRVMAAGIECVVANGGRKDIILKIMEGGCVGTTFRGKRVKIIAKKRWIAFSSKPKGAISIDSGAKEALFRNKSLLASGILVLDGIFAKGDVVGIADKDGKEFARGLTNYSSSELQKIKGLKTDEIKGVLGYKVSDEVVHKDNLVIL